MPTLEIGAELFRRTCARFATGIAVATVTTANGKPMGLTVNSFTAVSCCPPLVLICVDYRCNILPHFRNAAHYAINILGDKQRDLSVRFSEKQPDRFEGLNWHVGETGAPVLEGCLATFECNSSQVIEAGDHAIFIGEVAQADYRNGNPLLYYASGYRHLADCSKFGMLRQN